MDEVLKSEVVLVVLDRKDGVLFSEFAEIFYMIHGYHLTLSNYGYKSLNALLNDMKDVVELKNVDGQNLIQYRAPSIEVITPQKNELDMFETDQSTSKTSHTQLWSSQADGLTASGNYVEDKGPCKVMLPSKQVKEIISKTIISYPAGVKATRMRKMIMNKHNIDLEFYSRELGYTDMLSMLKHIPGITFVPGSKKLVLKTRDSHEKSKTKLKPPTKVSFSVKELTMFLGQFSSGIRVQKLIKLIYIVYKIDLEKWSQQLGYTDTLSMLKHTPGITVLSNGIVIAYDFTDTPTLQLENLKHTFTNIDLDKYVSELGYTDVSSLLQQGATVVNSNHIVSEVSPSVTMKPKTISTVDPKQMAYKQSPTPFSRLQPLPVANPKANLQKIGNKTLNAKLLASSRQAIKDKSTANLDVPNTATTLNKVQNSDASASSKKDDKTTAHTALLHSQNISTATQACSKLTSNSAVTAATTVNVTLTKTVISNLSYASVCTSNLGRSAINHNVQHIPASFNVQKAQISKVSHPKPNTESKGVLPSSTIKENLRWLLKCHSKGLSIFQLQKLYLLKFNQPLIRKGESVRKLLRSMKDVAKISGIGVQLLVYPVFTEKYPTTNSKINSSGNNEEKETGVSVPLTKHQLTTDGSNQKKLAKECILASQNHKHAQLSDKHSTCDKNENLNVQNVLNSTDQLASEWLRLPQKFQILKKIKQGSVTAHQQQDNKLCLKQKKSETLQPQEHKDSAPTTPSQVPLDNGKQGTQSSSVANPLPHLDFFTSTGDSSLLFGQVGSEMVNNLRKIENNPLSMKSAQKYNISKEIKQISAHQQQEKGQDKLCLKQKKFETLQPQEHKDSAQTKPLKVPQDLLKIKSKNDHGKQEPQSPIKAHHMQHMDFFSSTGIADSSLVNVEIGAEIDNNVSKIETSLPSRKLNVSVQKYHISKEINQSSVTARQQQEMDGQDKLCLKQKKSETLQPPGFKGHAQTTPLQVPQDLHKSKSKMDNGKQGPQSASLAHPMPHLDFSSGKAMTDYTLVNGEIWAGTDNNLRKTENRLPSGELNISAQNTSRHSENDLSSNHTAPNYQLLSLGVVNSSQSRNHCPNTEKLPLEIPARNYIGQLSSLWRGVQQNIPGNISVNAYRLHSPENNKFDQEMLSIPPIVSPSSLGFSLSHRNQLNSLNYSSDEEEDTNNKDDTKTWQTDYDQSCCIL